MAADPALVGLPDQQLFEWATEHVRVLVTENVKDGEVLRRVTAAEGRANAGLLYVGSRRFPRDRRFLGAIVAAVDRMITTQQMPDQARGQRIDRYLEDEAWPQIHDAVLGRPIPKAERETILGYGPEGV